MKNNEMELKKRILINEIYSSVLFTYSCNCSGDFLLEGNGIDEKIEIIKKCVNESGFEIARLGGNLVYVNKHFLKKHLSEKLINNLSFSDKIKYELEDRISKCIDYNESRCNVCYNDNNISETPPYRKEKDKNKRKGHRMFPPSNISFVKEKCLERQSEYFNNKKKKKEESKGKGGLPEYYMREESESSEENDEKAPKDFLTILREVVKNNEKKYLRAVRGRSFAIDDIEFNGTNDLKLINNDLLILVENNPLIKCLYDNHLLEVVDECGNPCIEIIFPKASFDENEVQFFKTGKENEKNNLEEKYKLKELNKEECDAAYKPLNPNKEIKSDERETDKIKKTTLSNFNKGKSNGNSCLIDCDDEKDFVLGLIDLIEENPDVPPVDLLKKEVVNCNNENKKIVVNGISSKSANKSFENIIKDINNIYNFVKNNEKNINIDFNNKKNKEERWYFEKIKHKYDINPYSKISVIASDNSINNDFKDIYVAGEILNDIKDELKIVYDLMFGCVIGDEYDLDQVKDDEVKREKRLKDIIDSDAR